MPAADHALANGAPDRRSSKRLLHGDPGVWTFIVADMAAFGLFFLLFMIGLWESPTLYAESRALLDPTFGLVNTVILLTSGAFMVQAVDAAARGQRRTLRTYLALAVVVGAGFGVTKVVEYTLEIRAGISMLTNDFFMYYFVLTGIHFLHFVVGMGVLVVCLAKVRSEPLDARFRVWIESAACYWHMVDLLWIVLFPMIYLLQ